MRRDAPEWQQGGGGGGSNVQLGSAAAASSLAAWRRRCIAASLGHVRHWDMVTQAATNAMLPPHAATVAKKTPAATATAGAQTINNQLKARKWRR